jgi:hypothetical protein
MAICRSSALLHGDLQILGQRIELRVGDLQVDMDRLHVAHSAHPVHGLVAVFAGVLARAAGELAELLLQAHGQLRHVEIGEGFLDARVAGDQRDEGFGDLPDAFLAAQSPVGGVFRVGRLRAGK